MTLHTFDSDSKNLCQAMKLLHSKTVFPVKKKSSEDKNIGSTFMYRTKINVDSDNRLDFHRAIDVENKDGVEGDAIVAPYPGIYLDFKKSKSGGGNVVKLRHAFPKPFEFKGKLIEYFYTWYSHLNLEGTAKIVEGWDKGTTEVKLGQKIGLMGKSGDTKRVHLHFEVKIGTSNSLYYQLKDGDLACRWGFDPHIHPHIHPLMIFEPELSAKSETELFMCSTNGNSEDIKFCYQTNRKQPLLNRVETKIIVNDAENSVLKSHIIDLNLRTGIVPSIIENDPNRKETWLDNLDRSKPYFEPVGFGLESPIYETKIIVPSIWINDVPIENTDNFVQLEVMDIWGNPVKCRYPELQ